MAMTKMMKSQHPPSIERNHTQISEREMNLLASGIAHDFNNILTTISGILSISLFDLKEDPKIELFPSLEENLEIALKATERATGLTKQLLNFSKGGQPIKKNASLKDIIKDSTKFILSGSSVAVNFKIQKDIPAIDFDPDQISQVIQNLVLNAKQAMNNNGNLYIKLNHFRTKDEFFQIYKTETINFADNFSKIKEFNVSFPSVCLCVEDTGSGITSKIQKTIFQPNITSKKDGNGLGLASSYEIMKRHNGYLGYTTKKNVGTTFFIFLPIFSEVKN
ncbi:MAG: two-component system sensor histidine kinase NtrB [Promethearchaeota archaeon]